MDRKLVDRAWAAAHGGCGHAFHPSSPSWFQSTHESTHYAPPAHVADVQFYALTHAFLSRGPHQSQFRCPSTTRGIDIQLVPSIHRNIEEIALPFVIRDRCFIRARRKIFANSILS